MPAGFYTESVIVVVAVVVADVAVVDCLCNRLSFPLEGLGNENKILGVITVYNMYKFHSTCNRGRQHHPAHHRRGHRSSRVIPSS